MLTKDASVLRKVVALSPQGVHVGVQGALVSEFGTGDAEGGAWTSTLKVRSYKMSTVSGTDSSIRQLSA